MLKVEDGYIFGEEKCIMCKTKMIWYCKIKKDMPDIPDKLKAKIMPNKLKLDSTNINFEINANIFFECPRCEAITNLSVIF